MHARTPLLRCIGVLCLTMIASCADAAQISPAGHGGTETEGIAVEVLPNMIGGHEVADLAAASKDAAFTPISPKGLGEPEAVYVGDSIDQGKAPVIELDYRDPTRGLIIVRESFPAQPESDWQASVDAIVALNDDADTHGTASAVTVRGGHLALLTIPEDRSTAFVRWYERPDLLIVVTGATLDPDVLQQIVETM